MGNKYDEIREELVILNSKPVTPAGTDVHKAFIENIEAMVNNGEKIPSDLIEELIVHFKDLAEYKHPAASAILDKLKLQEN